MTETPLRDEHYTLAFGPTLTIPAGATEGMTTFTITPTNDTDAAQRGAIYIQITVGAVLATRTIVIADDDTNSMNISLTAELATISEGAGTTDVTVTGTLDGKVFDNNVVVFLTIDADINGDGVVNDDDEAATRDIDYTATVPPLIILAGSVSATTTITITPVDDKKVEADETIRLTVPYANNQIITRYADGDEVKVTVGIVDIILQDSGAGGVPSFAADAAIADQTHVVGRAIADWMLPEALGGDGELTYITIPAGATEGTTTLTITPTNNDDEDGLKTLGVQGMLVSTGEALSTDIEIRDDEAPSTSIRLSAAPNALNEDASLTTITLTATLDGKALEEDATVRLAISLFVFISEVVRRNLLHFFDGKVAL